MINNIKLKDLVWKEIDKEKELKKLEKQWYINYHKVEEYHLINNFYFDNAEQIAKEKAEILNKQIEYTKEDIIDMFVEAGFEYDGVEYLTIKDYNHRKRIKIASESLYFYIDFNGIIFETRWLELNDRKKIEFYYNTFRNILEMEINCE